MRLTSVLLVGSLLGSAACMRGDTVGQHRQRRERGRFFGLGLRRKATCGRQRRRRQHDRTHRADRRSSSLRRSPRTSPRSGRTRARRSPRTAPTSRSSTTTAAVRAASSTSPARSISTISVSLTGAISIHATGTDVEVNSAMLDIDADAVYTVSASQRSLAVTSKGSGIGPRGNDIDHSGNYTLTWDPSTTCGSIAGHWQTDFSNATDVGRALERPRRCRSAWRVPDRHADSSLPRWCVGDRDVRRQRSRDVVGFDRCIR